MALCSEMEIEIVAIDLSVDDTLTSLLTFSIHVALSVLSPGQFKSKAPALLLSVVCYVIHLTLLIG